MKLTNEQTPRSVIEEMLGQSLDGPFGNAWSVVGTTKGYLLDSGFDRPYVDELLEEAFSGDYENLLRVCAEALLET